MKKLIDLFFRDSVGKVVIAQAPNLPIMLWMSAVVIGYFVQSGSIKETVQVTGTTALAVWALLELFQGVNYFRRTLGLMVLVFISLRFFII